jgi:hypothetical protein
VGGPLGTRAAGLELEGGTIATPNPHHVKKMLLVYVTGGKYFALCRKKNDPKGAGNSQLGKSYDRGKWVLGSNT